MSGEPAQVEVLRSLGPKVEENLHLLLPVANAWQPSDLLPDFAQDNLAEQLTTIRNNARAIPDPLLVVIVGDTITEEALPSYSVALNRVARDVDGDPVNPWGRWLRGWTAEENRHGDLLNTWLRLSGRVDMRAVERTIHHLLNNGFSNRVGDNLYGGLVYGSFQERATKIAHANAGKLAGEAGDPLLARICQRIAGDEARHETFYVRMMRELFVVDPDGATLALRSMLRGMITMPARRMEDGTGPGLFDRYAAVAQRLGVYTVQDYAAILEYLLEAWQVGSLKLSGEAARDQEWLARQPERYRRQIGEIGAALEELPPAPFSWIHGRSA